MDPVRISIIFLSPHQALLQTCVQKRKKNRLHATQILTLEREMGGLFQWESFRDILNKDFRSCPQGCKVRSRLVLSAHMLAGGLWDAVPQGRCFIRLFFPKYC